MLRSVCSHSLLAFAVRIRSRGEVMGRDMGKLRRIFSFIFYSVLIYHFITTTSFFTFIYIKAGGGEREIH